MEALKIADQYSVRSEAMRMRNYGLLFWFQRWNHRLSRCFQGQQLDQYTQADFSQRLRSA